MTRHMLFVGFSLRDDNFHQIVYDVRKAAPRHGETESSFGTALFLEGLTCFEPSGAIALRSKRWGAPGTPVNISC